MKHRIHAAFVTAAAVVLIFTLAGPAIAQDADPNLFGDHVNFFYLAADEFTCSDFAGENCDYYSSAYDFWTSYYGGAAYANLRLPAGALILGYRVIYEDSDDQRYLTVTLRRKWYSLSNRGSDVLSVFASSAPAMPGITDAWVDVDPDVTVRYRDWFLGHYIYSSYSMEIRFGSGASFDVSFSGVLVSWKRQISPAPATATFDDVQPGDFGFQHVEALYASGITAGCDATHFCPDAPLTRAQMAVFLAKALGLHWDS